MMPKYKNIVILTGAGISAESGLATFRSEDGLWNKHRVEDVATIEAFYRNPDYVHEFYNEMRPELFAGQREKGLRMCGFSGEKPVLMMMGGSSGAQSVNKALRDILPRLLETMDVLHLTGKGNLDESLSALPGYRQYEFLSDELPDALACADLILSRAGSNAICEFQALKKPMLLVPYPKGASRGDQILNAESFRKRGLCHVLLQENMTADALFDALMDLQKDREQLVRNLTQAPPADGTQAVLRLIREIQK